MKIYNPDNRGLWAYASIGTKLALLALLALMVYPALLLLRGWPPLASVTHAVDIAAGGLLILSAALLALAAIFKALTPTKARIARMVRRGLYDPSRGNPLRLRRGDQLPRIRCKREEEGRYALTVSTHQGVTADTIHKAAPSISAALNGRLKNYAVICHRDDLAGNFVTFLIDDVAVDRSLTFNTVEEMRPTKPTLLRVDTITDIDLTTAAHTLVSAKTRSGKTTGCLALLLQILLAGPDQYGSDVVVVDGKKGELSQVPGVFSIDENGDAHAILDAMQQFANNIIKRQSVLNGLTRERGTAVMWWDADMHASILFIDEYIQIRAVLPSKPPKDEPDYSVAAFDALLQRAITTGASAGCYVMLSTAEASVESGGLPSMLRSAMSTRVLFRPTLAEAKLLWGAGKVEGMVEADYKPGDAWFTTTDSKHEAITSVHFPHIDFPAYGELGRLLREYHGGG